MKHVTFLLAVLMAVPACAYQTGQANRTNFGAEQQAARPQYRSFSNYNNRSWGQGVQTQGVQTQTVQTELATQKQSPAVGKKQVAATPAKPAAQPTPTQASSGAASQTVVPAQAAGQPPAEAAAMMQQVQGMMNMVNNMTGQTGMPAGMPDMSALMGGNTQTPSAPKVPQGAKR